MTSERDRIVRLGRVVAHHRRARRMTINRLAALAYCDKSTINRLEHGRGSASIAVLWAVADALGVPLAQLIAETSAIAREGAA